MKLNFDITPQEFHIVQNILENHLSNDCKVWVFGSRAKNNAQNYSDLDLAIECLNIDTRQLITRLKDDFTESDLPYTVDVLDINRVEPYFQKIINNKKILFPFKAKLKVPQLRFPEFSGDWEEKKLGSVTNIVMGQSPNSTSYNSNGIGLYLIQGNADIKKRKTLPRVWTDTPTKECKVGDIIMTVRAPVGAIAKSIHNACIGRGVCAIINNQHSVSNYIYQFLLSFENKWVKFEQGSTFTAVNTKDVKTLKLNLPTKPEQQKIAAFLSAVDNKIEQLSKKQALLGEYKKGVMQKLFNCKWLMVNGELKFKPPSIRFNPSIHNSEFTIQNSDFPDWEEKKLGDVFSGIKGRGLSKGDITVDGLNKCILYGELYTTYLEVIKNVISRTNSNDGVKSKIGDLLVPCSTTTTGVDLADVTAINEDDILLGGDISILRLKKDGNSVFFAYYLTHYKKFDLAKYGQGSTIVHLYYSHFKKIDLKFPSSISEQTKIANFLSSIDAKIEQVGKQLDESKQFKKALLQQMFV